jgi:dihydroorotate dehydrogenase (NAD+) catalytic subunit
VRNDPIEESALANLNVSVCGLQFSNPILPAAGPPSKDGATLQAAAAGGAGGLVTKTISVVPAIVPRPCMAEIRGGFLNTELWSELPKEQWIETEYALARATGLPVIVGLGYTADQIRELGPLVKPFADALELSTHYVGNDISPIIDALQAAKASVDVPVFMKLSPHPNIQQIAVALEEAGADGLVMINSFGPCMSIDLETGLPLMGSKEGYGWLSGAAIKPLAIRCIYDAARVVKIPIFGVGGIVNGRDVAEMFMAGASAVQVCTEAILRGPAVYAKLARELDAFLDKYGYASVNDIKGLTIRRMAERGAPMAERPPYVDMGHCSLCGLCEISCPYHAISQNETALLIDKTKCFSCGLCVSRCKRQALAMAL